jgi:hypothetical protein
VFGLSPEWLLYNGKPIASTLVLGHNEELRRLTELTPDAAATAMVAGDPSYDRMQASRHRRDRYRAAFGLHPGQKLVTICTTWSRRSLMGSWPTLFREVLACLPRDEYRVAGLIHPNVWHGHGPWQVHSWLADCVRSGLVLAPPAEGWQATLIASDLIIGDFGATTCYGAACDLPTLLAAFAPEDVAPGSAGAELGRHTPTVNRHESPRTQVERAFAEYVPGTHDPLRDLITSCPGEAAGRLRGLFYGHLRLPEPATPAVQPVIPDDLVVTTQGSPARADHVVVSPGPNPAEAEVVRYPADPVVDRIRAAYLDDAFLVVHEDHPQRAFVAEAAAIILSAPVEGQNEKELLRAALAAHPRASVAAVPRSDGSSTLTRDGTQLLTSVDAGLAAALVHEHVVTGLAVPRTIAVGPRRLPVRPRSAATDSTA